jgi:GNAT superfamily N-acetyltransferase
LIACEMSAPVTDRTFTIRPPRDVEGAACRMLLRGADQGRGQVELLVAVQTTTPYIAGALSFRRLPGVFGSLRLRVVRSERGRGIGGALLREVLDQARGSGVQWVCAVADADADTDAQGFLGHFGFTHHVRLVRVEGAIDVLFEQMTHARARLQASGKVPSDSRLISLSDATRDQVARLYAEHIAHNPDLVAALSARPGRNEPSLGSLIAMAGDEVAGFLLGTIEHDVAHVHALVVAPAFRRQWPTTVLLAEAMTIGIERGASRARFDFTPDNHHSSKLAQRLGAQTLGTIDQYRLDMRAAR